MSKGRKSYVKRRTETEIRVTENLSGGAVLTRKNYYNVLKVSC